MKLCLLDCVASFVHKYGRADGSFASGLKLNSRTVNQIGAASPVKIQDGMENIIRRLERVWRDMRQQ